jgi:alpha/beta hydrolase family protein
MIELGAWLLAAHAAAHAIPMAIAGRRALLEIGLRRHDPARHRLYLRREGEGSGVLFLHGLGGSWRYWRRGVDGVRAPHRVYLPDLLGFGRSPKPRGDHSLSMHVEALRRISALLLIARGGRALAGKAVADESARPDLALRELRGGHHLYLMYPRLLNRLITASADASHTDRAEKVR